MECLEELILKDTWLEKPLASFSCTTSSKFWSIKSLILSECKLSEGKIPGDLSHLSYLEDLDLSNNLFNFLPASICQLPRLKYLDVSKCSKLDAMQALPSSIAMLKADETRTYTSFPDLSTKCKSLWKISLCTNYEDHEHEPSNLVLESLLQGHLVANHRFSILISGGNIPKWFSSCSLENRTQVHQPSNWYKGDLLGFALCASLSMTVGYREYIEIQFDLLEKGTSHHLATPPYLEKYAGTDVLWLGFMTFDFFQLLFPEYQPCDWTTYEGSIGLQFRSRLERDCITSCAIRPVYKEDVKESIIPALENSSLVQNYATRQPWLQQEDGTYEVDARMDHLFWSTGACLKETGDRHAIVSFGI